MKWQSQQGEGGGSLKGAQDLPASARLRLNTLKRKGSDLRRRGLGCLQAESWLDTENLHLALEPACLRLYLRTLVKVTPSPAPQTFCTGGSAGATFFPLCLRRFWA